MMGDKAGLEATAKALDVLQDLELEVVHTRSDGPR